MDENKNRLQEQQAPEKNTDKAFVRVNHDGSPAIPETAKQEEKEKTRTSEKPEIKD